VVGARLAHHGPVLHQLFTVMTALSNLSPAIPVVKYLTVSPECEEQSTVALGGRGKK
jgi:hypothetical protein